MPRMRNRSERCFYCHEDRTVDVNLDTGQVIRAETPTACKYGGIKCIEELRDKCLLPTDFVDGKLRHR